MLSRDYTTENKAAVEMAIEATMERDFPFLDYVMKWSAVPDLDDWSYGIDLTILGTEINGDEYHEIWAAIRNSVNQLGLHVMVFIDSRNEAE